MNELPMNTPEEIKEYRYAELMVTLPASWPLSPEALKNSEYNWPIEWLKTLARMPHIYDTFLGWGHTIPNGDPPEPFANNTKMCCMLLLSQLIEPEKFYELKINNDKTIYFYDLFPIYKEEMDYILKYNTLKLIDIFETKDISLLLDIKRKNVCKRTFKLR